LENLRQHGFRAPVEDLKKLAEQEPSWCRLSFDRRQTDYPRGSFEAGGRETKKGREMRTFKVRQGPFQAKTLLYQQRDRQNLLGELTAVRLLPSSPSAVRIERPIEKRFALTRYEELPAEVLGYVVRTEGPNQNGDLPGSGRRPSQSAECRINTTLAHQAGHCLLHGHLLRHLQHFRNIYSVPTVGAMPPVPRSCAASQRVKMARPIVPLRNACHPPSVQPFFAHTPYGTTTELSDQDSQGIQDPHSLSF
jgi:hypothetical protein